MIKRLIIVLTLLIIPTVVTAQTPQCGTSEVMRTAMHKNGLEAPMAMGVMLGGRLMELWRNESSTTWSITITAFGSNGSRYLCIMAIGDNLQPIVWGIPELSLL
tara:strand:+ start:818 stop:1129 length:312 start_codon:yes stop_codon:yes gene_type:complete